jgi:hypothetical protein
MRVTAGVIGVDVLVDDGYWCKRRCTKASGARERSTSPLL